ncbi:MAG: prepilin-type N-terminal cleavage/methylation domain-containing protein [Candidatus Omnitrophota bacterium]
MKKHFGSEYGHCGGCVSRSQKGFTLIELVMIILLTSILALSGYHLMNLVVRNTFFLPNEVQADLVAAEAMEILVEGDDLARGLRFCKVVTTASANQIVVTNQDDKTITYNLSGGSLFRTIAPGGAVMIPYFKAGDMTLSGSGGSLFTYYDSAEAVTATPANVRRIKIDLVAQNGTGSSDNYEGYSQQSSSVKVNKYL